MKDNGFTLVELLAVIVILAALLVITVPSILNSQNSALGSISAQEKRNIEEAGRMIGIDLDDYTSSIYNCKSGSWIESKCTKNNSKWTEVKITISDLITYDYFTDQDNHCSGEITVTKQDNGYTVNLDKVECDR